MLDDMEMAAKPTRYYGIGVEEPGQRVNAMLEKSHLEYLGGGMTADSDIADQDQLDQIRRGQEFGRY